MRFMFSIAVLMIGMIINAQDVLTISGQVYTDNNETWLGVNIPRSLPVKLFFINNTITSVNTLGYMLQAGDEVPDDDNNNLDGEIITGNKFIWNGNDIKSITHGLFTGHNKNVVIEYNYLDHVPMGIIRKSGTNMNNTSGGVAYNIVRSPNVGIVIKGMSDVCIYNNTLYQDRSATETDRGLIDVYSNTDVSPISVSHGTRIFNNIFYTKYTTYCIKIIDLESLTGFESDYNVFYSESGSPRFSVGGSVKTFSEWQALGYDVHSVVVNPRFKDFVSFVPVERLDYGTDLGSEWNKGLSIDAVWGNSDPEITIQNGKWQAGARIYGSTIQIPEITGAVIETATPARLDLIFNLAMANIIPVTSSFKVTVNSLPVSLKSLAISGNKALLELSSPVTNGDVVTISYTKPSENPIQSINGGQVASFTSKPVINNVESFRPVLVAASVENSSPYTIRMLYDLLLAAVKPPVSAFTVMINSVPESVNKVEISGKEVLLTLEEPVANGDVITVAYTIPSLYALRSASGWYVLSFNAQTVTNNLNSLRPVLVHSSVENNSPDIIELTFNLDLSDILPPASAFNVMVNSIKSSVNKVEVSGTKVFLTLAGNVVTGDVITVSYTIPSVNALRSVAGWYVLSFGAQLVTNNVYSPRPVLISSSVENNAPYNLKLTFSLNLSVGYVPPSSAFMVNVNSVPRVVSSVALSGTDVTLTLSNPIVYGDHITVAYAVSANALRSVPGWYVLSFGPKPVTNNVLNVRPALTNAVVEFTTPDVVDLTFSLPLSPSFVPPFSAFNVLVNSSRRTINSISISDIRVQLVLAGSVASGDVVTVAYSVSTNALRSVSGWYVLSFCSKPVTNKCLAPSSFTAQKPSTASDIIIKTSQASRQENSDILLVGTGRINIYPNPVNGNLNIDIPEPSDEIRLLRLYDITGKISLETWLEPNVKNLNIPLQIKAGTYILKIFQGNRSVLTKKLVVLK